MSNVCLNFPDFFNILCDFPQLFQSVRNSLIFPGLENAFPFFQVFPSEREPCKNNVENTCYLVT